jgi:hypothetical protein
MLLGLAALLAALVTPAGMLLGFWLVGQIDARRVTVWAAAGSCVISGAVLLESLPVLTLAIVLLGLANGVFAVAANLLAAGVEQATGRLFLPWCHGLMALGAFGGALLVWQLVHFAVPYREQAVWTGAVGLVAVIALARVLPRAELPDSSPRLPPNFALLALGASAALVALDAVSSWSGGFHEMASELPVRGSHAVMLGVALGGLACRVVADRIGLRNLLGGGAVVAAVGLGWIALSPTPDVALAGHFVVGFGLSCVFPVLLGRAAAQGSARHSIAALGAVAHLVAQVGMYLFSLLGVR